MQEPAANHRHSKFHVSHTSKSTEPNSFAIGRIPQLRSKRVLTPKDVQVKSILLSVLPLRQRPLLDFLAPGLGLGMSSAKPAKKSVTGWTPPRHRLALVTVQREHLSVRVPPTKGQKGSTCFAITSALPNSSTHRFDWS